MNMYISFLFLSDSYFHWRANNQYLLSLYINYLVRSKYLVTNKY